MSRADQVDTFLKDNPCIALLARQAMALMELHNRLVDQGKIPAYSLMGNDRSILDKQDSCQMSG